MPRNKFLPGQKRPPTSGRKKGTPNKKTEALLEIFEELKYDPARALLDLVPELEPKEQLQVHRTLMEYKYPKRKAIEHSGSVSRPLEDMSDEELQEIIQEFSRGAK